MASVSFERHKQITNPAVAHSEIMEVRVEETPTRVVEDKIYVAVGKDLKKSRSTLNWTLRNSGNKQICIFHVHKPAETMGTKFRIRQLKEDQVTAYHEKERQDILLQHLDRYNQICHKSGVSSEVRYIEMDSIEKGIVEFVLMHNVRRLVMGAAADKKYSRKMVDLKSRKAVYVRLQAAAFCHIYFICKGNLIFTRQGSRLDELKFPVSLFENIASLQVLDLSNTSIKCLPSSISNLTTLQELFLRKCDLMMELPPEIGALNNLKVFDSEGTQLICLPEQFGSLTKLECLNFSLYSFSDKSKRRIFADLSNLTLLKELSICVDSYGEWWEDEVKLIIDTLSRFRNLESLKLYFPTTELLGIFMEKQNFEGVYIYQHIMHFSFIVGRLQQRLISRLPHDLETIFAKLPKFLKCTNCEGDIEVISKALRHANSLILDRHWTISSLSTFGLEEMENLKFCILGECNEMLEIINGSHLENSSLKRVLGSLEYLSVYYMKSLSCIWKGSIHSGCLANLKTLKMHSCPELTTVFTQALLNNLTRLEYLILDDCEKIKSLISLESNHATSASLLPNLKKISLLHLVELVSIFDGVVIAPRLESLVVYNCPNLEKLSHKEVSNGIREIKGENEWWDALKWCGPEWADGQPGYLAKIFIPLGLNGDIMDELDDAINVFPYSSVMVEFIENVQNPSPSNVIQKRGMNDELYKQLAQAVEDAENSRRDALEESIRRRKAEKDAIEAKHRVGQFEKLYVEEMRLRQEINKVLERRTLSDIELLQSYKKERDDALKLVEEKWEKKSEITSFTSSSSVSQLYTMFDFSEVKDATSNFDPSRKIGEGNNGSIYRGFLRHTEVAIKMLNTDSLQGPSEFQQEVNVLSKLRHPNVVTLIGACPDSYTIIYEYLSGGSLEDRLNCKNNTPPLSWQTRIRIAVELCSVLIFLQSYGIVHCDIKPANLLLDENFVTKLCDFGISYVLPKNELSDSNTFLPLRTDPKGTFASMDPEFLSTGELILKSDTYAFGIILLRLLTGRRALGLSREVKSALNKEKLKNILDPTAGDWPFVQAQQLAVLAMSCCDVRKNRPDLATDAWKVLEPMRVSSGLSSLKFSSETKSQIPHYFICPIVQKIMQDPVVAADGFTYEADALKGWLDSGHTTSPMTNLKLANSSFVPNLGLRFAIQEWLKQS